MSGTHVIVLQGLETQKSCFLKEIKRHSPTPTVIIQKVRMLARYARASPRRNSSLPLPVEPFDPSCLSHTAAL